MNSRLFKFMFNLWPPLYGTGIRVLYIAEDYKEVIVEMKLRFYNKNYVGSHFGGSLYSMVDPFYMLMLMNILGRDYIVWDKAAKIEFVNPGKGAVRACFKLRDEDIGLIKQMTENGDKYLPEYQVEIKDSDGNIVALVDKTLYIRKKGKRK